MSQPETKTVTAAQLIVDAILVGGFFLFFAFYVLPPHVPSANPFWINFWSIATGACMACVFWLCVQMFRVVYKAQKANAKSK